MKSGLGNLLFLWRFDRIREELPLSLITEKEERFKDSVWSMSKKKLWGNYKRLFQSKTWNILTSYYFNVFLIKQWSYRNWVTPKDLDSDDDGKRFGYASSNFGVNVVHVSRSSYSLTCFQNKVSGWNL